MILFSEKTNELIKKATKNKDHIKFTIGVLHEGETSFKLFDSKGEIPYESYLYESGSITKVFTTSLFAKYLQEGKMSLDDSIAKYIPELDDEKYLPTLKKLATHTAGYSTLYPMNKSEYFKLLRHQIGGKFIKDPVNVTDYVTMDYEKAITLANDAKVKDKDYKWKYSNYGISLLGQAIATVAEKSFWDLMNQYLIQDLGLKNTFMGTDSSEILTGYDLKNRNVGNCNWQKGANLVSPAGAITSTPEDLLEFAKMNIEQSPNYLGLCHEKYANGYKKFSMGLGWWIDKKNPNLFYHGGNTQGFASMLAFDKKKKAAVVILANVYYYKEREKLFVDILENLE